MQLVIYYTASGGDSTRQSWMEVSGLCGLWYTQSDMARQVVSVWSVIHSEWHGTASGLCVVCDTVRVTWYGKWSVIHSEWHGMASGLCVVCDTLRVTWHELSQEW